MSKYDAYYIFSWYGSLESFICGNHKANFVYCGPYSIVMFHTMATFSQAFEDFLAKLIQKRMKKYLTYLDV